MLYCYLCNYTLRDKNGVEHKARATWYEAECVLAAINALLDQYRNTEYRVVSIEKIYRDGVEV